jgi:signal transduction histidine kinase
LGLAFPLTSLAVTYVADGASGLYLHWETPALWIVNLAPILLALAGLIIGGAHAQLNRLQQQTQDLAERVAREWTAEIHDNNVAVADAAETRSKFFASLSHDMRTPLTAIMGFCELAEVDRSMQGPELRSLLIEVGAWGEQLLDIVNDLMDAAKLEAGRVELQIRDIDGDEIAQHVVDHLRPLADEKSLELNIELHAAVPVRADRQRFRQILINLVSNAVKYTDAGWVRVRSYALGDRVIYEVQDSGAGISEVDMPKVFTPFEQTSAAKGRQDSTGLGLPVSLGMAEAMGGSITAESLGAGRGATFRLVLEIGTGHEAELRMASLPALAA